MVSHYGSWPARPLSHQRPAATHQAVPAAANPACVRRTLPPRSLSSPFSFWSCFRCCIRWTRPSVRVPGAAASTLTPRGPRTHGPRPRSTRRPGAFLLTRLARLAARVRGVRPVRQYPVQLHHVHPLPARAPAAWLGCGGTHLAVCASGRSALSAGSVRPDRGAAGSALSPVRPGFRPGRRRALWTCMRNRVGAASARGPSLGWPTTAGAPLFPLTAGL